MSKKIIIVCHEPLTERIKSNFYIDDFIFNGFDVEYWDVSQCVFPGMCLEGEIQSDMIKRFDDTRSFSDAFKAVDMKDVIFVVEIRNNWKARHLYKVLSASNALLVRIDLYGNTVLDVSFIQKLKSIHFGRVFKMLQSKVETMMVKMYRSYFQIRNFDKLFSSTVLFSNRISINHPDYEKFVLSRRSEMRGYIVFLDIYYPLHPDLLFMLRLKRVSPESYYKSMRSFFDRLEEKYNMPVSIAAHPKANYNGSEFGDRKIVYGMTDRLVRDANIVLLHTSNSISFPVLYNKPIVLVANDEFNKTKYLVSIQRKLSLFLNIPVYNIDKVDIDEINIGEIDEGLRVDYVYSYLTSKETESMFNKEIIIKEFLEV